MAKIVEADIGVGFRPQDARYHRHLNGGGEGYPVLDSAAAQEAQREQPAARQQGSGRLGHYTRTCDGYA